VSFAAFYRSHIEPAIREGDTITHVVLGGLDGYRCVLTLEDAFEDDVLIADHLDGHPLDSDHGAPVRLVSPQQYAFCSAKHLCLVELHTAEPRENFGTASRLSAALMVRPLFSRPPRARVWQQERNAVLPASVVLPMYRLLTPAIRFLSARGSERRRPQE
jgi:DMSO/TMAO reductase YedYZ molybdopterin-dependent catalytic subunit